MPSRRQFLQSTTLAGVAAATGQVPSSPLASAGPGAAAAGRAAADLPGNAIADPPLPPLRRPAGSPAAVATAEAYWGRVRAHYRTAVPATNLEAGFFGMMAQPVLAAYHRHIDRQNRETSWYARRAFEGDQQAARRRVAEVLGCAPEELAFSRGATEALQCLITQYRDVGRGDTVLYADTDYNAMQWAMNALAAARGAQVVRIALPEPLTRDAVLATYARAFADAPRLKLVLLTHLNNKNGGIIPVRELVALARRHGADAIVDAAHSFGQVDLTLETLGADFVGGNLHKWFGAPVGAGFLYIKGSRLDAIDRHHADEAAPLTRIESRIHTGTMAFATIATIPDALDFHAAVGPAHKAARLRLLRDRWVRAVRPVPGVELLTADGPDDVGAITSFRLRGETSRAACQATQATLLERFGVFTQWRTGLASGDCIRVTPALYNTLDDMDRLARAITTLAHERG